MTEKQTQVDNRIYQENLAIGRNLRLQRTLASKSQDDVASVAGVTYQQIQKYEAGENYIKAARLKMISDEFKVPIHAFFQEQHLSPGQVQKAELFGLCQTVLDKQDNELSGKICDILKAMLSLHGKGTGFLIDVRTKHAEK